MLKAGGVGHITQDVIRLQFERVGRAVGETPIEESECLVHFMLPINVAQRTQDAHGLVAGPERPAWGRVGLVPDAGSAFFLPRLVGWGRALDMVLTGDPVSAEEALRFGLVTRVWPDSEFATKWRELAQTLARGATEAFALTKEGLNAAMARGFAEFLDHEADLQDRAGRTHDYAEGVRAFSEKRSAKMEGR